MIKELEDNGFLSTDRLVLLKGILKVVEEWTLFQQVEKFEAKRTDDDDLESDHLKNYDLGSDDLYIFAFTFNH